MSTPSEPQAPSAPPTKPAIRRAIADGQLLQAAQLALAYAEQSTIPEAVDGLAALTARINLHEKGYEAGNLDFAAYSAEQAAIIENLLNWTGRLPDQAGGGRRGRKPLRLSAFKMRVFVALCVTKLIVLVYLFYQYQTGGYSMTELQSTAALLAPALAAYLSVILADYIRQSSGKRAPTTEYVAGPLVTISWFLFPVYAIALLLLIRAKPAGVISFGAMSLWLGLVESGLGGYIGQIVHALFKKE